MVYLRKKKVKGVDYLYLVKSVWDKERKTSKQITIKYLGESKSVTRNDIPIEFRDDPKINSFLLENTPKDRKNREEIMKRLQVQLFSSVTEGDLKESIRIYELFVSKSNIEQFYEKILNPIMEKIGSMWADGRLSIATEHISSNTAQSLIKIISENHKRSTLDKGKVIITTPVGEEHCLSCNMIESFLLSKGFTTFNLSPSTPANSLVEFIKSIHPTAVLISITLDDNIKAGQRLTKKIYDQYKRLPVYVGGQALNGKKSKFNATVIEPSIALEQIPKILIKKQSDHT
jgi:methanogenic corrinoid protein MtbC1